MEINIKYNMDDKVYFMQDNKINCGKIWIFKILVGNMWDMQTHNCKPTDKLNITIQYKICTDNRNKISSDWVYESDIYSTKEELLKSL